MIAAAARALAQGDAIGGLKRVALRDDPPALALRGIAMAQLGDLARSRELLRRAARAFGAHEAQARARCRVAEAEVALAMRDLGSDPATSRELAAAAAALDDKGDHANATHARLIAIRRALLLGRLDAAGSMLRSATADQRFGEAPPSLQAIADLAAAELAMRSMHTAAARLALARAAQAAQRAAVPALAAEVAEAHNALAHPAARRLLAGGGEQALRLHEVEALLGSGALVVDACRRAIRVGGSELPLARRPILFTLARALAAAWPGDAERNALIAQAFRMRDADETHRARLRVEIGRLRALLAPFARIDATARGFALQAAQTGQDVAVLIPAIDGEQASLLALLADGAAWSTSALALALGESQRTVQRDLAELESRGRVRSMGRARALRWLAPPIAGFTTILLLPASLPPG